MRKLKASTLNIASFSSNQIEELYNIFSKYYKNVDFDKFKKDFLKKDKVILLKDKKSKLIKGFSTLKIFNVEINNKKIIGLFSGDTVIDKEYWGQSALTFEFFKNLMKIRLLNLNKDFYWYLISKGYKTYLLLTNNFKNYYPRYDKPTSKNAKQIIDTFSFELFEDQYIKEKGIIIPKLKTDSLRNETAPINHNELLDPNIKYFEEINPNWNLGEELCCIGRVDIGLIQRYLSKFLRKKIIS